MRSPADGRTAAILAALTLALAACGGSGNAPELASTPANGPQADYPVVLGASYDAAGRTYTPEDVLNYDEVGYLAADAGAGVTAAHHTLPLPSYVEVTSLDTGRTALIRVERRGPMDGGELLGLSNAALEQLGLAAGAAVRVRRVNPLEEHRALLRAGQAAPLRMDTPMPLVEVLRRKLPTQSAPLPAAALADEPIQVGPAVAEQQAAAPAPAQVGQSAAEGGFVVQAAAFSTADRADRVAAALGGQVIRSGKFFRVRTGPFTTRGEAEASLAKVKASGYTDARILTSG